MNYYYIPSCFKAMQYLLRKKLKPSYASNVFTLLMTSFYVHSKQKVNSL